MPKAPKKIGGGAASADGPYAVLSSDQIADLWERGYSVIPRTLFGRDVYGTADVTKRPGMAQQWGDKPKLAEYRSQGWRSVTYEAWPGLFAPYGAVGDVEIDGLILMQKPQHEVDRLHAAVHARAEQNVADWKARQEAAGFTVDIKQIPENDVSRQVDGDGGMITHDVDGAPTMDTTVGIPRDMMPHIKEVLAERDRICDLCAQGLGPDDVVKKYDAVIGSNPQAPKWPTLRAIVLPMAIDNIRAKLNEGATHGKTEATSSTDRREPDSTSDAEPGGAGGSGPADDESRAGGSPAPAAPSVDSGAPGPSTDVGTHGE